MLTVLKHPRADVFSIGTEGVDDFDQCNLAKLPRDEQTVIDICVCQGAMILYRDIASGNYKSREEYREHITNYYPDREYIVPIAIFTHKRKAENAARLIEP